MGARNSLLNYWKPHGLQQSALSPVLPHYCRAHRALHVERREIISQPQVPLLFSEIQATMNDSNATGQEQIPNGAATVSLNFGQTPRKGTSTFLAHRPALSCLVNPTSAYKGIKEKLKRAGHFSAKGSAAQQSWSTKWQGSCLRLLAQPMVHIIKTILGKPSADECHVKQASNF